MPQAKTGVQMLHLRIISGDKMPLPQEKITLQHPRWVSSIDFLPFRISRPKLYNYLRTQHKVSVYLYSSQNVTKEKGCLLTSSIFSTTISKQPIQISSTPSIWCQLPHPSKKPTDIKFPPLGTSTSRMPGVYSMGMSLFDRYVGFH